MNQDELDVRYSDGANQVLIQIGTTWRVFGQAVLFKSIEQSRNLRRSSKEKSIFAQIYRADIARPWIDIPEPVSMPILQILNSD